MCIEQKLSLANRPSSEQALSALLNEGGLVDSLINASESYAKIPLEPSFSTDQGVSYRSLDLIQSSFIETTEWRFMISTQVLMSKSSEVVAKATLYVVGEKGNQAILNRLGRAEVGATENESLTTAALLSARGRLFSALGMPKVRRIVTSEAFTAPEDALRGERIKIINSYLESSKMKLRELFDAKDMSTYKYLDEVPTEDLSVLVEMVLLSTTKKSVSTESTVKKDQVESDESIDASSTQAIDDQPSLSLDVEKLPAKSQMVSELELHLEDKEMTLGEVAKLLGSKTKAKTLDKCSDKIIGELYTLYKASIEASDIEEPEL
jgi:predicted XRE-type DNA-binding protein